MRFRDVAAAVGVETYPENLEAFYNPEDQTIACDLALIDRLQSEYNIFGDYYDIVRECAVKINADPLRSAWVRTGVAFAKAWDFDRARTVPIPKADGTQITSMLPFYILVAQIPDSMAEYRRRGFSEKEIRDLSKVYRASLEIVETRTGLPGTNALFYRWDMHFIKAQIFRVEGLEFEMRTLPDRVVYLQEQATGCIVPVICDGTYHRSGVQMIGSAGYDDMDGAFTCSFSEDEKNYYGYATNDCVVSSVKQTFPKNAWQCLMRPGDPCLGMHIPTGADISIDTMNRAIDAARALVKERYPEFKGERVYCSSWLLDPMLGKILGENAKITQFQDRYVRYPEMSTGMNVFGNVFPTNYASYEQLPEDTRLQRALKKLYMNGGYIYAYSGVIF